MPKNGLPSERLAAYCHFDTCTISNAIERTKVRLRNEGFIHGAVTCRFPELAPVIGYAVTGRVRSSMAPVSGRCYYENIDFWRYVNTFPRPRIIVLEDCDHVVGLGALFGEVHARICRALDCVGYVTNGAVRDLAGVQNLGFQLFSGSVAVSHAYAHVVDFGDAIEIGGLSIEPGDLLHGDIHGVHSIPLEIADQLPELAEKLTCGEQELFRLCERPDFSLDMLEAKLAKDETEVCG